MILRNGWWEGSLVLLSFIVKFSTFLQNLLQCLIYIYRSLLIKKQQLHLRFGPRTAVWTTKFWSTEALDHYRTNSAEFTLFNLDKILSHLKQSLDSSANISWFHISPMYNKHNIDLKMRHQHPNPQQLLLLICIYFPFPHIYWQFWASLFCILYIIFFNCSLPWFFIFHFRIVEEPWLATTLKNWKNLSSTSSKNFDIILIYTRIEHACEYWKGKGTMRESHEEKKLNKRN